MNLTDDQVQEMKEMLNARYEYSLLVKEHNSAKSELMKDFLEKICPKPSGRLNAVEKEKFKEDRKIASTFLKDVERLYLREINQEPDTTQESLMIQERL